MADPRHDAVTFSTPPRCDVLIIGGGVTGTAIARDLALRGVNAIVAEWRDVASGASGGNHGLLHSGARYVASDREAAVECREEGDIQADSPALHRGLRRSFCFCCRR